MFDSKEILPGWTLKIDEKSNNVYQFVATNKNGYKSDVTDSNWECGYRKCLEGAFDIEQKIGKNRNKFFYDILLYLIGDEMMIKKRYDDEIFGSWIIQGCTKRIILDGRDFIIWIEEKKKRMFKAKWILLKYYKNLENLHYSDLEQIAKILK